MHSSLLRSAGVAVALIPSTPALSATFYDNLTGSPSVGIPARNISAGGAVNYNDPAYGFVADISGALGQIDLGLAFRPGASFSLSLTTSAFNAAVGITGQAPATVLGQWTLSDAGSGSFSVRSIGNITGINLTQGTAYWLHATPIVGVALWADNSLGAMGPLYQCGGSGCASHVSFASAPTGVMRLTAADVGAIPEPATWAMMIAGFAAIGGAIRKGTRTVAVA